MSDAARLDNLKQSILELYKARFERCYELTRQHADRVDDDLLTVVFNADARFQALTLAIQSLRDEAAELADNIAALAAVRASVAARSAQADTGFRDYVIRSAA